MRKAKILLSVFCLLLTAFLISPKPAHASILDDIVNGVKNTVQGGVDKVKEVFNKEEKKEFSIESKIELASGGDLNKNDQIDAGDYVKFSYTITNPTKNTYKSTTLKTNINTNKINSVANVRGVMSLDVNKDNISIPYLNIEPNQVRRISFEARINFYKDADQLVSTEAELVDEKNASVFKSEKKEVTAKKMDAELFNKFVHITK